MKILSVVAGVFFAVFFWEKLQTILQGALSTITNAAMTGQIGSSNLVAASESTEERFREAVADVKGFKKGNLRGLRESN